MKNPKDFGRRITGGGKRALSLKRCHYGEENLRKSPAELVPRSFLEIFLSQRTEIQGILVQNAEFGKLVPFSLLMAEEAAGTCPTGALPRGAANSSNGSLKEWVSLPASKAGNDPSLPHCSNQVHAVSTVSRAAEPQFHAFAGCKAPSCLLYNKNTPEALPWLKGEGMAEKAKIRTTDKMQKAVSSPWALQMLLNHHLRQGPSCSHLHRFQSQACK